jgi:hypothetical protein
MPKIEVYSESPTMRLEIEFNGESFALTWQYGEWNLLNSDGNRLFFIGKRERWTKALGDALEHLVETRS